MDLRVGGHVHVQTVLDGEVFYDSENVIFPLKKMYDRATGTLEGLSAPYGTVGDVAPQGLFDLGVEETDNAPLGLPQGDAPSDNEEEPESGGVVRDSRVPICELRAFPSPFPSQKSGSRRALFGSAFPRSSVATTLSWPRAALT